METIRNIVVDSVGSVAALIATIEAMPWQASPSLFLDLEGANLGRNGTISILTLYLQPNKAIYLVDVHTLQGRAFTTPNPLTGQTLQSVLEAPHLGKVFFDVRGDSDALHHHFGVRLQGVEDVQLMENASRFDGRRRFLAGLSRCIASDAPLPPAAREEWHVTKERGISLYAPERGGSFDVFDARPMSKEIRIYCANDVRFLPALREIYWWRMTPWWQNRVAMETLNRVAHSQSAEYSPTGEWRKYGPFEYIVYAQDVDQPPSSSQQGT